MLKTIMQIIYNKMQARENRQFAKAVNSLQSIITVSDTFINKYGTDVTEWPIDSIVDYSHELRKVSGGDK